MTKALFFLLFTGISVNTLAQSNPDTTVYQRASDGSEYKIFASGKTEKLVNGNYMELSVIATYRDSVLFSTYEDAMPQYGLYDTSTFPTPFKEIFLNINNGDSVVLKVAADSIMSKGQAAPFMQKGTYIYQHYRIVNVYTTKEQVDSAQNSHAAEAKLKAEQKQQQMMQQMLDQNKELIAKDSKTIETYLTQNKLKAIKAKLGTYIVITKEGTGPKLAQGYQAAVNYTGRSFSNKKVFDSNTDPKFKHVEPYMVEMSPAANVILGWTDALAEMQKGTRATIYVPSTLGFGSTGRMPDISPDEILVFDMEVKDAMTIEEAIAKAEEAAKKVSAPAKAATPEKPKPVVKSKTVKPVSKSKPATKKTGK
ncbi:FKBP-type peptidyl-prolyl cis-trans isomerase [Ferruginibacter profundus]